jgi:hypothetical protein
MTLRLALTLFAAVVLMPVAAQACKLPKALSGWPEVETPKARVAWKRLSGPIRVGKPFALEVAGCLKAGAVRRLRAGATMPAHGHGMNYKPAEKILAPGWSRFDGFLFHMPGKWQLTFDLYGPAGRVRLTATVDVTR